MTPDETFVPERPPLFDRFRERRTRRQRVVRLLGPFARLVGGWRARRRA